MAYSSQLGTSSFSAEAQPSRYRGPALAAVPHLYMGLVFSIPLLGRHLSQSPAAQWRVVTLVLSIPFLLACLVVLVYARRRPPTLWTAAWEGYALLLSVGIAGSLLPSGDEGGWDYQIGLIFLAMLAILGAYFLRFRKTRRGALLMGLFLVPVVSLINLDTVPLLQQAVLAFCVYLLFAAVSAGVVLAPRWSSAALLGTGTSLLAGVAVALVFVNFSVAPAERSDLQADALYTFVAFAIFSLAFYYGPWLLWTIRDFFFGEAP